MQAVNLSHYILEHLPLKRLAKGIAVKTKFWLLHGERKFIPMSLGWPLHPWRHVCEMSTWSPSARTHPWMRQCVSAAGAPWMSLMYGYLPHSWDGTTATLSGAAICTFHCVPLQGGKRRSARGLSVAPWDVGVLPIPVLPCLCLPQQSTVVQLGVWKVTSLSVSCNTSLWIWLQSHGGFLCEPAYAPSLHQPPQLPASNDDKNLQISKPWLPGWGLPAPLPPTFSIFGV